MTYAYSELYLEKARMTLGSMINYAINCLQMDLNKYWNMFLVSPVSTAFARGDVSIIAGKSGIELVYEILKSDEVIESDNIIHAGKSREYWLGWALAYYQWYSGKSFDQIDREISIDNLRDMYTPYHEMDIRMLCDKLDEITRRHHNENVLKRLRRYAGYTQKELAIETGIPLRTIQQYEQGQKKLIAARFEYIIVLSRALNCEPHDLIEI